LSVTNLNEPGNPDLHVQAFYMQGTAKGSNTRSHDLFFGMENPNIRVPPFAESFIINLTGEYGGYTALLSDSQTGETYGEARPNVRHPISHPVRWVRFMNYPPQVVGTLTFFLSI
jgi:hypothetical protein